MKFTEGKKSRGSFGDQGYYRRVGNIDFEPQSTCVIQSKQNELGAQALDKSHSLKPEYNQSAKEYVLQKTADETLSQLNTCYQNLLEINAWTALFVRTVKII